MFPFSPISWNDTITLFKYPIHFHTFIVTTLHINPFRNIIHPILNFSAFQCEKRFTQMTMWVISYPSIKLKNIVKPIFPSSFYQCINVPFGPPCQYPMLLMCNMNWLVIFNFFHQFHYPCPMFFRIDRFIFHKRNYFYISVLFLYKISIVRPADNNDCGNLYLVKKLSSVIFLFVFLVGSQLAKIFLMDLFFCYGVHDTNNIFK